MTGDQIRRVLAKQIGMDYTGGVVPLKVNQIMERALIRAFEKHYMNLVTQGDYDNIRSIVKTNATYTPTANVVTTVVGGTAANNIPDYYHLLAVKAQFNVPLSGVSFSAATNATPIVVTITGQNNIATGDSLFISGSLGNTNVNGLRYIKMINSTKAELYSDPRFLNPVVGNGVYVAGSASVSRYFNDFCVRYYSDRKIGSYASPDADCPKFDNYIEPSSGNAGFLFYPSDLPCVSVTMDYLTTAPLYIDLADTVVDVEEFYPRQFIYIIINETAMLLAGEYKDESSFAIAARNNVS